MTGGGPTRRIAGRLPWAEICSALLVVLFAVVVAARAIPLGIPGQWVWPRRLAPLSGPLMGLAALGALLGTGLFLLLLRAPPRARWACGLSIWAVAFAVRLLFFHAEPGSMLKQVWTAASPVSNTYFSEAVKAGPAPRLVRNYVSLLPKLAEHARTHPPGPILFYKAFIWLCRRFGAPRAAAEAWALHVGGLSLSEVAVLVGERTGIDLDEPLVAAALWAQTGLCAASALLAVVCFLIALSLGVERKASLGAAALFALSPSALLFSTTADTLVALLCGLSLLFAVKGGGGTRGRASLLLGGLLLYVASFTSLSALAMGAVLLLFLLLRHRPRLKEGLSSAGWLVCGFALTYAVVRLAFGFDLGAVAAYGLSAHREVTAAFERSYLGWLLLNPLDFAAFGGLPSLVLAGLGWRDGRARPLLLSLLVSLALLDISGLVRGEVARIWLFLLPPLCVASGPGLAKSRWPALHLLSLALQAALAKIWLDVVRPF